MSDNEDRNGMSHESRMAMACQLAADAIDRGAWDNDVGVEFVAQVREGNIDDHVLRSFAGE